MTLLPERHCCGECGGEEAHHYYTGCHCWFHGHNRNLDSSDPKLIAIRTGKRDSSGRELYRYVENSCAHKWHEKAREEMLRGVGHGSLPQIPLPEEAREVVPRVPVAGGDQVPQEDEQVEIVAAAQVESDHESDAEDEGDRMAADPVALLLSAGIVISDSDGSPNLQEE